MDKIVPIHEGHSDVGNNKRGKLLKFLKEEKRIDSVCCGVNSEVIIFQNSPETNSDFVVVFNNQNRNLSCHKHPAWENQTIKAEDQTIFVAKELIKAE